MNRHFSEHGYFSHVSPLCEAHGFRWQGFCEPGRWKCGTVKPATDEGRPAELCRRFDAVCDDFGTLVEVPA